MDKLCEKLPDDVVIKVTHGEHRVKPVSYTHLQMLNAINCNVPHRYIREMVTGKSEEPEKRELLIGAPKEEKQGGKKK